MCAMLHEGVSCDVCLTENFRGLRYKCLTCYDYDLCQRCFASKMVSSSHKASHPMQCLIAKGDFALYYGPEPNINPGHHVTFTCPLCGQLGLSQTFLVHHVRTKHAGSTQNVICPMCAGTPGCDPNVWTADLAGHLTSRHASSASSSGGSGGGNSNGGGSGRQVAKRSGKSIGRKIAAHSLEQAYGSEIFPGGPASMLFDERGMSVDPEDPIVDLLMQLSTMRSSPFSESGGNGGGGGGGSSARESSRTASTLMNRAQRNRIYAQLYQHRQQGLSPAAHMTAAAAAAAGVRSDRDAPSASGASGDQVRAHQKQLKKYFAGGSSLSPSAAVAAGFLPKPPPGMRFGVGHPATAAAVAAAAAAAAAGGAGGSGAAGDLGSSRYEGPAPHPNELCTQILEDFERYGYRDEGEDVPEMSPEAEIEEAMRIDTIRSAYAQELLMSLMTLDDSELSELAASVESTNIFEPKEGDEDVPVDRSEVIPPLSLEILEAEKFDSSKGSASTPSDEGAGELQW